VCSAPEAPQKNARCVGADLKGVAIALRAATRAKQGKRPPPHQTNPSHAQTHRHTDTQTHRHTDTQRQRQGQEQSRNRDRDKDLYGLAYSDLVWPVLRRAGPIAVKVVFGLLWAILCCSGLFLSYSGMSWSGLAVLGVLACSGLL